MEFLRNEFVFFAACTIPWIIAGWVRIWRYARYYQLEGYSYSRYLAWFEHNKGERRYQAISCGFSILLCVIWWLVTSSSLEVTAISSVVLAGVALYFAPRDREVKQRFVPTQRAVRLIVTSGIVQAIPALAFGLGILSSLSWFESQSGSPEATFAVGGLVFIEFIALSIVAGGVTYLFTPYTLPIANAINWPIEEAFRRYYLHLARRNLVRSGATVIAITGSYGKTSTKHYLNHILAGRYRVLMTPKSFNTLLGISRVINDILSKDVSYDYFIVEAGAYIPGEIAQICKLVRPQISMVITVGPMHLERFGSIENVVRAKYEIIESLPQDGVGVFNADDERVRGMAARGYPPDPKHRILITRQNSPGARLAAANVRMTADGLDFDVRDNETNEDRAMHAPLYGEHNVTNILMAIAVARHLGMSLAEIAMRVATLEPAVHRLNRVVMPNGTILIDDAYSANPVGTRTALDVLALHNSGARRVVVSSGMFELGPLHEEENRKLGERLAEVASDVILIGKAQTEPVQAGLRGKSFPADHLHVVDSLHEAVQIYKGLLRPGDALLILTDLPDTYA